MASVLAHEIPEEQQFMADFWIFRKTYYNAETQDEWWTELVEAAEELSARYDGPNTDYYDGLILVCVDDIERRYRASIGIPTRSDPVTQTYLRIQRARGKETAS